MKIILEGLKMSSGVIDCPDNLGPQYIVAFHEPAQLAKFDMGIPSLPPLSTRAIFSWSGKHAFHGIDILNSNGDKIATEYPRIYRLTNIEKF